MIIFQYSTKSFHIDYTCAYFKFKINFIIIYINSIRRIFFEKAKNKLIYNQININYISKEGN